MKFEPLRTVDILNIAVWLLLGLVIGQNFIEEPEVYELKEIGVAGTGSMLPLIYPDDKLVVEKIGNRTPELKKLYVFRKENKTVVHRLILKLNSTHYIFKGDNRITADKPVAREQIVYEVKGIKFN